MSLNFPNSPAIGDIYDAGAAKWRWTGAAWARVGSTFPEATLEDFGAVGDGVTDDSAALLAASLSGLPVVPGTVGATYLIGTSITTTNASGTIIDLTGCEVIEGPNTKPGWQFVGCADVYVIGGRSGKWTGNRDTAGAWKSHATTGGITDGDGTGSAAATYTGVNTITVNLLGTGHVKKGSRLSYIVSNVTYSYIVQADVAIVAGTATGIVLDRVLDVPLPSGRTVYINWYNRHMVLASAATAGATSLVLECGDVTSADGAPMMLAGDQFWLHGDYNNIDNIDFSHVFEVAANASFTGSSPAKTVTVQLTAPIPANIPRGTMISSIMDHRNNRYVPILFWDCTRCGVIGMNLSKARLHGFTANAVINAPWLGLRPSLYGSSDMVFADNTDDSTTGAGAAIVGVWAEKVTAKNNRLTYALGSSRRGISFERSSLGEITGNMQVGGQKAVSLNGECTDMSIHHNEAKGVQVAIAQLNSCSRVTIESNTIKCDPSVSLTGIVVFAGLAGEEEEGSASSLRTNFTQVLDNTISGGTLLTNANYGSHIQIAPIGFNAATREEDYPREVVVRGNTSIGAGRNGIRAIYIDACTIDGNKVYQPGYEGIYLQATGGANNRLLKPSITDAGRTSDSPAVRIVGGTDWEIDDITALVDTGTGQTTDLVVESGATVSKMRSGRAALTVTPEFGGAVQDGVTDDLAAYEAAYAGAPANARFVIDRPSHLSGAVDTDGKNLLIETTNRIAWPSQTDLEYAMPGITGQSIALVADKVTHKQNTVAASGGTQLISQRILASSSSPASYEWDLIRLQMIHEDPSTGTGNGGSGTAINRDGVAFGVRTIIPATNTTGRAWVANLYGKVEGEGRMCVLEVDVDNEGGSVVTGFSASFLKQGIHIVSKGNVVGSGIQINDGGGQGFVHGYTVRTGAINATYGEDAFLYEGLWKVTKDGYTLSADGTAANPGISFYSDPDTGFTRPAANTIGISIGGAEWGRISSGGNLYIGDTGGINGLSVGTVVVKRAAGGNPSFAAFRASADSAAPSLFLVKSRGTTVTDYTIVSASDELGRIAFRGAEGTTTVLSAAITSVAEGTPAAGDVRAGVRLLTGSGAGTVGEALRADINQNVSIGGVAPVARLHVNGAIKYAGFTVATLPSVGVIGAGGTAYVSDSSVTTFRSTVAGGGSSKVMAFCDGTNWIVH